MRLSLRMPRKGGGAFITFLVVIFVLVAVATFLYLQRTGKLAEYKVNMFSSIGTDNIVSEEQLSVPQEGEDELSIGVTEEGEKTQIAPKEEYILPSGGGKEYKETAEKGDGITRLARRAVKEYLKEHNAELTAERKIFVEDYIQNHIGDRGLRIGESITISEDLITDGINKSQELTQEQLNNLKNFTELVWEEGFRL